MKKFQSGIAHLGLLLVIVLLVILGYFLLRQTNVLGEKVNRDRYGQYKKEVCRRKFEASKLRFITVCERKMEEKSRDTLQSPRPRPTPKPATYSTPKTYTTPSYSTPTYSTPYQTPSITIPNPTTR